MFNNLAGKVQAVYNQSPSVSFQSVCQSRLSGFEISYNQKVTSNVFLPDLSLCLMVVVVPCFKFLKYRGKSHSYSGQPALFSSRSYSKQTLLSCGVALSSLGMTLFPVLGLFT